MKTEQNGEGAVAANDSVNLSALVRRAIHQVLAARRQSNLIDSLLFRLVGQSPPRAQRMQGAAPLP